MSKIKDHGSSSNQNQPPQPPHAEQAKTMVIQQQIGSLSTQSKKHPGWPFGSVMPYSLDDEGNPVFLISSMAMHTQNLKADARASLLVMEDKSSDDPLSIGRVTLMGEAKLIDKDDVLKVKNGYLKQHPDATFWVDFPDFSFYRMTITSLYFVGGFGRMDWVTGQDYYQAESDPLMEIANDIIEHMNEDHVDAMVLIAKHHDSNNRTENLISAKMTAVDRLGFHLQLTTEDDLNGVRINFPKSAESANSVRKMLVQMATEARNELN